MMDDGCPNIESDETPEVMLDKYILMYKTCWQLATAEINELVPQVSNMARAHRWAEKLRDGKKTGH